MLTQSTAAWSEAGQRGYRNTTLKVFVLLTYKSLPGGKGFTLWRGKTEVRSQDEVCRSLEWPHLYEAS